jgi:hypothetical protein
MSTDDTYWSALEAFFQRRRFRPRDMLGNWPAYAQRCDVQRFLAHYELFKTALPLPGAIVELGVYEGGSFFTWSLLLETFCPSDAGRRVYGFDSFEGLETFSGADGFSPEELERRTGTFRAPARDMEMLTALHNGDETPPGRRRAELVVGRLDRTLPGFLGAHPGLRISLLHFDLDLYEPTRLGLELLYPLVVPGGVVCFDEYGIEPWQGETSAVDEYLAGLAERPALRKYPFSPSPGAYVVKGERP